MDGSIVLGSSQRKRLLQLYRTEPDPQVRLRAHILLLLADGRTWSLIAAMLFCSTATIARWKDRFERQGIACLQEEHRGRKPCFTRHWALWVGFWVQHCFPRDFGFCRSRWCCATLALVLWTRFELKASRETIRRWLHQEGLVWRRPRPVLEPRDALRQCILRKIRELLRDLPSDEAAVFQDEVDLNLNPEIGCMWMNKGKQAEIPTPGTNVKRYLAGSMNWRTGQLIVTEGSRRNADLFIAHLEDLRHHFRRCRVVHVICDNARFHTVRGCKAVQQYLAEHGDRIRLHYLPSYSPKDNPIERVWWHLREEITRNHRCESMRELVELTLQWLQERGPFKIEGAMYERLKARI